MHGSRDPCGPPAGHIRFTRDNVKVTHIIANALIECGLVLIGRLLVSDPKLPEMAFWQRRGPVSETRISGI
jgi:hypothetical protein